MASRGTVGERLRNARFDRGVTQVQLARILGMPQAVVSKIERGLYDPENYLERIEEWLREGTAPSRRAPIGPYPATHHPDAKARS